MLLVAGCTTTSPFADRPQDAEVSIYTPTDDLCWSGAIGGATHDGCGPETIPVHDPLGMFSSGVQKHTAGAWTLEVRIMVGGHEVASNETSAEYGVAQVIAP